MLLLFFGQILPGLPRRANLWHFDAIFETSHGGLTINYPYLRVVGFRVVDLRDVFLHIQHYLSLCLALHHAGHAACFVEHLAGFVWRAISSLVMALLMIDVPLLIAVKHVA